jgi:hypothetical protein
LRRGRSARFLPEILPVSKLHPFERHLDYPQGKSVTPYLVIGWAAAAS